MPDTDTRSLQQIKRETEQTRAGLTNTVEQLKTSVADTATEIRQRISPDAIKAEVSGYIKSRGEQLMHDVTSAARKNPMQAVAVGATLAYPLFRLARAIPTPILMVGAGLFLAGSKTGQAVTQKASDIASDLSEDLLKRAHDVGDQVEESATSAKNYASDQLERISAAASGVAGQTSRTGDAASGAFAAGSKTIQGRAASLGDTVAGRATGLKEAAASLGDSVASRAGDLRDQAVRMASSTGGTVQEIASSATSAARHTANTTVEAGKDAAKAARDTASDLADRAQKTIFQTIEQNPLIVAGVGLLIGGLIASALPRSEIEDDLAGGTSDGIKQRAQDAAAQGLDAAKAAAGEIYDEASRLAEAEGLTPRGISEAAQDIGQRVRRVAESAVTTAFEPEQENPQPRTRGATDHG